MRPITLPLALLFSITLLVAGCSGIMTKPQPRGVPVFEVVGVSYIPSEDGKTALVRARGLTTTEGWTDPKLAPREKPTVHGVYEFDMIAVPPTGPTAEVLTGLNAGYLLQKPPKDLRGIRVFSQKNSKEFMVE